MRNSKRIQIPLDGGFAKERYSVLGVSTTENMYVVDMPFPRYPNSQKNHGLVKWPGSLGIKTVTGKTGGRASFVNKIDNTESYVVFEDKVYTFSTSLVLVEIGTLSTTTGHVGIDQYGSQIIFVDGVGGHVYDYLTTTWTTISDPDFPASPIDVVSIDGYAIVAQGGTDKFHFSTNANFLSWPGAFAQITSRPDTISGLGTINRNLFVFGNQSTEVWYDAAIADFSNSVPFRRYNSLLPPYGCSSRDSIAEGFGYMFFLGKDENGVSSVISVQGSNFKPVSTPELEYALEQLSSVSDAKGDVFKYNGDIFYQLSFTTSDKTFVYHANRNLWYSLKLSNGSRHKMQSYLFFNNKHYFLGYNDNIIYDLSDSYYDNKTSSTDTGDAINCTYTSRTLSLNSNNKIQLNRVRATVSQGAGKYSVSTAYDPELFLSISRDEGNSFGFIMPRKIGSDGNYKQVTEWVEVFGASSTLTFKVSYYARTPFALTGLYVDIQEMDE